MPKRSKPDFSDVTGGGSTSSKRPRPPKPVPPPAITVMLVVPPQVYDVLARLELRGKTLEAQGKALAVESKKLEAQGKAILAILQKPGDASHAAEQLAALNTRLEAVTTAARADVAAGTAAE